MSSPDPTGPDSPPTATVSFRLWPPIAVGGPLFLGIVLTRGVGDPVSLGGWRVPLGWALVVAFVLWNGWALLLFRRHGTGLLPGQATTRVMDSGPFAVSRNPLYLGLLVLHAGLALLTPSFWALVLLPVAAGLLHWGAILPEEKLLAGTFGAAYDDYARRVRRWL